MRTLNDNLLNSCSFSLLLAVSSVCKYHISRQSLLVGELYCKELLISWKSRLDHQPLFGKGACAPPPKVLLGEGRGPDMRERRKSSVMEKVLYKITYNKITICYYKNYLACILWEYYLDFPFSTENIDNNLSFITRGIPGRGSRNQNNGEIKSKLRLGTCTL